MPDDKIRIVYFVTSLESGGTERQLAMLLEGMDSRVYEKHVICLSGFGPLESRFKAVCASLNDVRYPRLRVDGKFQWKNVPGLVTSLWRLRRILKGLRPDILHTLIPVCNVMGALTGKSLGIRVLVCSRLSLGNYRDNNRLFAQLENITDPWFTLIHCKSEGIKTDVIQREPVDPDRLRVIYNGLNVDAFNRPVDRIAVREELGIRPDCQVIGMVANLKYYKGIQDVIAALPAVLRGYPGTRLLVVGRDDGILGDLNDQAAKLGVTTAVIFAGERNDVSRLLQIMNVLISASHEEGFSNTIIEAMAAGLPVVATNVGGNVEQVVEGITGKLIPPGSPSEIAEALNSILADEAYAKKLGRQGNTRVAHSFSDTAVFSQMDEFYKEAIEIESD